MKHTLKITLLLVCLFFAAQVVGLAIIDKYIDHGRSDVTGQPIFSDLPYNLERPPVPEGESFILIFVAVIIGTLLVLLLVKFKKVLLWKLWFLTGVTATLAIAMAPFIGGLFAFILALVFALIKTFRPNFYIHNITEVLMYGGLAAIFVPILNLFSVSALLILISIYDMIAVWGIKHMVSMANFQSESGVFAGLMVHYNEQGKIGYRKKKTVTKKTTRKAAPAKQVKRQVQTAVLGGGDIGFALLFAGVVMKGLMLQYPQWLGFLLALIVPVFATIALFILFVAAEKKKFYPAMPPITIGCFLGLGALKLVELLL